MWCGHKHPAKTFKQNITRVKWENKRHILAIRAALLVSPLSEHQGHCHQLSVTGHKTNYNATTGSNLCYEKNNFPSDVFWHVVARVFYAHTHTHTQNFTFKMARGFTVHV
jgi:hypothetical protein